MMKYKLFLIIFLVFNIKGSEILPYEAKYKFSSDRITIVGIRKLEINNEDKTLSFKARNAVASLYFNSTFSFKDDYITSDFYEIKVRPKFVNRDQKLSFKNKKDFISSEGRDEWDKSISSKLEILDPLNAQIQIRLNVMKNKKNFSLNLIELKDGNVKENFYSIVREEKCNFDSKELNCVVVKRIRKNEQRETTYFLVKELNHMFLKIIDIGPDRTDTLTLEELLSLG